MGRARGKEAAATRTELDIAKSVIADYDSIIEERGRMIESIERDQQIAGEIELNGQIAEQQMAVEEAQC